MKSDVDVAITGYETFLNIRNKISDKTEPYKIKQFIPHF